LEPNRTDKNRIFVSAIYIFWPKCQFIQKTQVFDIKRFEISSGSSLFFKLVEIQCKTAIFRHQWTYFLLFLLAKQKETDFLVLTLRRFSVIMAMQSEHQQFPFEAACLWLFRRGVGNITQLLMRPVVVVVLKAAFNNTPKLGFRENNKIIVSVKLTANGQTEKGR
jgi:hypothetical protein